MKKVTAKHLMIGDWVKWRNKVTQVYGISPFTNNIALNEYIYDGETQWDYCTTATPIPITEEWLKLNKNVAEEYSIDFKEYYPNSNVFKNIIYIHQLQQAYRLATGKELKIKF